MPLDPVLIDVLACPIDKGPLWWFEDARSSCTTPALKKAYAVHDGIPVLLVDEAVDATDADHERWSARAAAGGVPETGGAGRACRMSAPTAPATSPLPFDSAGMWDATAGLPEQMAVALATAMDVELPEPGPVSNVVCCGMGEAASPATCWRPSPGHGCRCR